MKNFLISFPRSGQHLVERLLKDAYKYYDLDFSYCEFYNCCRQAPCSNGSLFTKNHDFEVSLPIKDEYRYLVLYRRDELRQIEAWFRMEFYPPSAPTYRDCPSPDYTRPQMFRRFVNFVQLKRTYFENFRRKWVEKNNRSNCLLVEYYDLVAQPCVFLSKVLEFFNPNRDFDKEEIQKILKERTEKIFIKDKNYLKDKSTARLRRFLQLEGIQL